MSDLSKYIEKQMKDPEFRAEHEATRAEFEVTRALIEARVSLNMTQKELAERSGIRHFIETSRNIKPLSTIWICACERYGRRGRFQF